MIGEGIVKQKRVVRVSKLPHYILSLPAVLLSGLLILVPGFQTIYSAFTKWNGISPRKVWIGLENFQELFSDWVFWQSVKNNFLWALLFLVVPVGIALLVSVLMSYHRVGSKSFQIFYLIPYLLAPTTNAIIWLNMIFSPNAGLIGYLQKLGWNITSPLGIRNIALLGVAMVDIWHYWGFLTVIFYAAMRQIPQDQIEAAELEGVNGIQMFMHVFLPNIITTVRLMMILIFIYSFMTYDYIYLLTSGGPAHATEVLSTFGYTIAFSAFQFGKASAVYVIIGLFGGAAAVLYTLFSRKEEQV